MNDVIFGQKFANELQNESPSTIKCLERIPPELFGWKPHERSMALGYLAALIAEIPKWVAYIVKQDEIDLATFPHDQPKTSQDLVNNFNKNVAMRTLHLQILKRACLTKHFI